MVWRFCGGSSARGKRMIEKRLYDCMGGMQVRVMVGWAGRWMQVDVCHGGMGR